MWYNNKHSISVLEFINQYYFLLNFLSKPRIYYDR